MCACGVCSGCLCVSRSAWRLLVCQWGAVLGVRACGKLFGVLARADAASIRCILPACLVAPGFCERRARSSRSATPTLPRHCSEALNEGMGGAKRKAPDSAAAGRSGGGGGGASTSGGGGAGPAGRNVRGRTMMDPLAGISSGDDDDDDDDDDEDE